MNRPVYRVITTNKILSECSSLDRALRLASKESWSRIEGIDRQRIVGEIQRLQSRKSEAVIQFSKSVSITLPAQAA